MTIFMLLVSTIYDCSGSENTMELVPLAEKVKYETELKWYIPVAILWVFGLCLERIAHC